MRDDYGWPPYVPVAERRAKALKQLEKMRKKGLQVQPVQLAGRKIAASFWGKGWCDHMESFSDYANRLPRGRSYVRNGSVCHLEIRGGEIEAMVSGTSLYKVSISIAPLKAKKWEAVKGSCSGRIGSLIDLLRGKLDHSVMEVVTDRKEGLFPLPGEMKFDCDCPDWAGMCKHVAAVLYGVGARLDQSPEMLFLLRGVNHEELVDVTAAIPDAAKSGTSRRRIAATGIADVFGIELAEPVGADPAELPVEPVRRKKPETAAKPSTEKNPRLAEARRPRTNAVPEPFPDPLTGDAIRAWRASLDETLAKFAARFKVSPAAVSSWEKKGNGEVSMFPSTLALLKKGWGKKRRG